MAASKISASNRDVRKLTEEVCFDKNDFMKANFSVDEFLYKNRNAPSLEQLRDDLGLYLKELRTSMIDLINEDYADFVSLAANLVGLDDSIQTIQKPLEAFCNEIESIKTLIDENINEIRAELNEKRKMREEKRNMLSYKKLCEAIKKLENLLAKQLSTTSNLRAVDLERAALELIQLKFCEKFCTEYLKSEEQQAQSICELQQAVLEKLRSFFNECLKSATSTSTEQLERCLRIYITLDACHTAEEVFREDVVAPYMNAVISEHCLQNSPQGLASIYTKVLNFISLRMTDLLRLTQYTDKLRGFNFIVNSFWADVEMRLSTHMTSIFAPGNSEAFYAKYKSTRDFMSKIEELLANETAVTAFQKHKQTISFKARWNLPVYFQICFQEIAGEFEGVLEPIDPASITFASNPSANNAFQVQVFNSAYKAIQRCWAEGVFLPEVFPKFYKLSVQIVLRISLWIKNLIELIKHGQNNLLIPLHADVQLFINHLPELQQTVLQRMPAEKKSALLTATISKSFADMSQVMSAHLLSIKICLVNNLITESGSENVRQVNDLPRLYRKTNRDIPTRSSTYVEQMLRPLKAFATSQSTQLGQTVVDDVLQQVCSKITCDYYAAVTDVLTSVQKTEESLRRLRNLKSGSVASPAPASTSAAMSDDDKIRLQLRVDVIAWTAELAKLHLMPAQIEKLLDLNNIVEESIKLKEAIGAT